MIPSYLDLRFLDNMQLMAEYPDGYFDLAIVDPPYGINAMGMPMGTAYNRSRTDGWNSGPSVSTVARIKGMLNRGGGKLKNRMLNQSAIDWDNEPPSAEYFMELFRVSKNQIIWGGNYFGLPATRCVICWDKMQPWENFSQWEMGWTSFDKPAKLWRISNTGGGNVQKKIHPTQKPVSLYDKCLHEFAEPGMKIIDTHLGSGNIAIAVHKKNTLEGAGLTLTACDNNRIHYEDMIKHVTLNTRQQSLFF